MCRGGLSIGFCCHSCFFLLLAESRGRREIYFQTLCDCLKVVATLCKIHRKTLTNSEGLRGGSTHKNQRPAAMPTDVGSRNWLRLFAERVTLEENEKSFLISSIMMMLKDLLFMGFYVSLLRFRSTMRMPRYFSRRLLSLLFFFCCCSIHSTTFCIVCLLRVHFMFRSTTAGKKI